MSELFGLTETDRKTLSVLAVLLFLAFFLIGRQRQQGSWKAAGKSVPVVQSQEWDKVLERARKVDVNTADVAELERLPGVGKTLARRIVAYRETHGAFRYPEALLDVEGIGPNILKSLEAYLAISR